MSAVEITSLSSKGQIVIPNTIRNDLGIAAGDKLVVISDGENILIRPIEKPKVEMFNDLIKKSQHLAKSSGIKKSDLDGIIKKIRDETSR